MTDYFSMSKAKRERATKLPWVKSWVFEDGEKIEWDIESANTQDIVCSMQDVNFDSNQKYIVHACNTLPKIEALLERALVLLESPPQEMWSNVAAKDIRAELSKLCKEGE